MEIYFELILENYGHKNVCISKTWKHLIICVNFHIILAQWYLTWTLTGYWHKHDTFISMLFFLSLGTQGAFDWHTSPKYSWRTIQSSSLSGAPKVSFWINVYARIRGSENRGTGILLVFVYRYIKSLLIVTMHMDATYGLPGSLDSKVSAYNAVDPGSTPGLGRSPGEGNGNPLQYLAWKIPWTEESGRL